MNFSYIITPDTSNLDSLDEGMEFGYRNLKSGSEWIPLAFYSSLENPREDQIKVGERNGDKITIRGYSVPFIRGDGNSAQLKLCGSEIIQNDASLSFRWLQTVIFIRQPSVDDINLDNVQISINSPQQHVLFMDNFNNQMSIR